jgi:hypothetical protein
MQLSPEAAQAVNRFIRETDWDAFWSRVMQRASPGIDAYEWARAKSLASAPGYVFWYCRRSLPEYLQFLYTAKGSLGETLTRTIGLQRVALVTAEQFEEIDVLHYEVENKLLGLIRSLESKRADGSWDDTLPPAHHPSSPIHHPS